MFVGRIGRPHGVRGESTVLPESDHPGRFAPGSQLRTGDGRELTVRTSRPYRDKGLVVGFEGVSTRRDAEALRGAEVTIASTARRPLDSGEFWPDDLVGLVAVDPDGAVLGEVVAVDAQSPQVRLVVATDSGEVLVPFVADLVADPHDGKIVIDAPEGLF